MRMRKKKHKKKQLTKITHIKKCKKKSKREGSLDFFLCLFVVSSFTTTNISFVFFTKEKYFFLYLVF